jgi:hypothetical protein
MRRIRKDIKTVWKQKIDPALDKLLIKTHVDFLTPFERSPREGRLNVTDDFIEPIIEKSDLQEVCNYQDAESLEVLLVYLEKLGVLGKREIRVFHAVLALNNVDDILKICPEMIKALPEEESKQFYINKIGFFQKILNVGRLQR